MNRKTDIAKRFPGLYNHEALDAERKRRKLSLRQVAARVNMPLTTARRVFKGKAHQKQAWPIAMNFKMDWGELHQLNLPITENHRAASTRAVR